MSEDGGLFLLLLGPAGGAGLYWLLYRYYRNTDKSHAFERETSVDAKPVTGADQDRKVDEVRRTQATRIRGDNVRAYRTRVQRVRRGAGRALQPTGLRAARGQRRPPPGVNQHYPPGADDERNG